MVDEITPEETPAEETPVEEQNEQVSAEPVVEPEQVEQEEIGSDGVPIKNRLAEAERKRAKAEEALEEMNLRMQRLEQAVTAAQPKPAVPQTDPAKMTQAELDEMMAIGPKAYTAKVVEQTQRELREKHELADATSLISEAFGNDRTQYGVSKVLDYAAKNFINIQAAPVKVVKKILNEMGVTKKAKTSVDNKKRAAEAIKNKPEGGKKPPAPPVNNKPDIDNNLRSRGSMDDAVAWLQQKYGGK